MDVTFFNRDFSKRIQPGKAWAVRKMEWRADGGCYSAEIDLAAGVDDLAALLRLPVEVWDDIGALVWWGYVDGVTAPDYSVDLGEMYNRVAVAYTYDGPDRNRTDTKYVTAYATHPVSIAYYGTREKIVALGKANDQLAISRRDHYLADHAYPRILPSAGKNTSTVHCSGWWGTLDWQYYANAVGRFEYHTPLDGQNNYYSVGDHWRHQRLAQGIKVATGGWPVASIWLSVRKVGACWDDLVISFCEDSGGHPGAVIGSASIGGAYVDSQSAWIEFVMSASANLVAGTQYWIMIQRTGGNDLDNYYEVLRNEDYYDVSQFLQYWGAPASWNGWSGKLNFMLRGLASVDSQVLAMVAAGGQFIAGCRWEVATGQVSDPYRDGLRTAGAEIEELLSVGTSAGVRLLVGLDANRLAVIRGKPTAVELVGLRDAWLQVVRGADLVGKWSRLAGVELLPVGAPVVGGQDGFIERVTWSDGVMVAGFSYS